MASNRKQMLRAGKKIHPDRVFPILDDGLGIPDQSDQLHDQKKAEPDTTDIENDLPDRNSDLKEMLELQVGDGQSNQPHDRWHQGDGKMFQLGRGLVLAHGLPRVWVSGPRIAVVA